MKTFEFVRSFGPTPLAELTARLSADPTAVAEELNDLTNQDLLKVSDEQGKIVDRKITPEDAESQESWVAELTPKSIKRSLAS